MSVYASRVPAGRKMSFDAAETVHELHGKRQRRKMDVAEGTFCDFETRGLLVGGKKSTAFFSCETGQLGEGKGLGWTGSSLP